MKKFFEHRLWKWKYFVPDNINIKKYDDHTGLEIGCEELKMNDVIIVIYNLR